MIMINIHVRLLLGNILVKWEVVRKKSRRMLEMEEIGVIWGHG
jgi:hypothetical protein